MRADQGDRVDEVLRVIVALGLLLIGLLGLVAAAFVFALAQSGGVPFSEMRVSYWQLLVPGVPAVCCLIGAGFVFPWPRRRSN